MQIQDINFKGKKALVRVDFNVPLNDKKEITDDTRMVNALPTIQYILNQGGSVILMSHLGRPLKKLTPEGRIDVGAFTMAHLVPHLSGLLGQEVLFATDCGGPDARAKSKSLQTGQVLLLENTRFYPGEEKGDDAFAKNLARLADIYINDAFGTAHRAHASTTTIAHFFGEKEKAFGYLMLREIEGGNKVLKHAESPFVAIIGGAKVSDKIGLISNLIPKCDTICIGGGMAYTFIKAQGGRIGRSLVEDDKLDKAKDILESARIHQCTILLPEDSLCAEEFANVPHPVSHPSNDIPTQMMGLDIGPKAIGDFSAAILQAKTIVWNGPMGVFEMSAYASGTMAIAKAVAASTEKGAFSLIGGGDSVAAINQSGLSKKVSFISTGGGAMLELLEGKTLPGIQAILEDPTR